MALGYESFEAFGLDVLKYEKVYLHRLANAHSVEVGLKLPIGNSIPETHLRPLSRIPESEIAAIWEEAKRIAGHGGFENWLKAEFEMSQMSATRFINVANSFGDCKSNTVLDLNAKVLYALSAPSTTESVRTEIIERVSTATARHGGFENWLKAEFDYEKAYLHRLAGAYEIEKSINSPIGESIPERHLRPLSPIPEDERAAIWEEAKRIAGHGGFESWLKAEFEMTKMSATRFMNVAEQFGDKSNTMLLLNATALYALSAPSMPDEVRAEIQRLILPVSLSTATAISGAVCSDIFNSVSFKGGGRESGN